MKITDLRCVVLGENPVIRILTDEGIDGYGQIESTKPYIVPHVLYFKDQLLGEDPTNVERVMLKIRQRGAFKPWGSATSAIEIALWDIAGKAAGIPVYKLLGGKVRDRVRIYNGGLRFPMEAYTPEEYADVTRKMMDAPEGFTIIKQPIGFHSPMSRVLPDFFYGDPRPSSLHGSRERGALTERGLKHLVACVEAMKEVTGDRVGLALDCGPGFSPADSLRFAKAVEPFNLMWLEDLITGDYTAYVSAEVYRDVTWNTTTPIHTGEQIYLRQNFKDLIERQAINVVGPDPEDVGGIAELKWIAEYADLHGIMMAPHGVFDGLIGLAAHVQMAAALPHNFIAFEYPYGKPSWWYDIVKGLPDPIVQDGHITVWDRPGLGIEIDTDKARQYLKPEDAGFFD